MLVWDEARSREQEEGSFVDQEAATLESGLKNPLRSSPFEVLTVELSSESHSILETWVPVLAQSTEALSVE
jgi:hypothetical protein